MAEYETIAVKNPLKESFSVNFNGEPYRLEAGEEKHFPKFLAYHIAKHLSNHIIGAEIIKMKAKKDYREVRENPLNSQMMNYDNPQRRIALFDILGSKETVQECVSVSPLKGFIGNMSEYDTYVEKSSKKIEEVEA